MSQKWNKWQDPLQTTLLKATQAEIRQTVFEYESRYFFDPELESLYGKIGVVPNKTLILSTYSSRKMNFVKNSNKIIDFLNTLWYQMKTQTGLAHFRK